MFACLEHFEYQSIVHKNTVDVSFAVLNIALKTFVEVGSDDRSVYETSVTSR